MQTEKQRKDAEIQRRAWKRRGRVTRGDYSREPRALPAHLQEEIISRHRRGETRAAILKGVKPICPGISEYQVRRVLRVFCFDPDAFKARLTEDIVAWRV